MFSQAPREKDRPRPATLHGSAFSAFRKSFSAGIRKERGKGKDFPNLPKKRRWVLGAAISRALRVCVLRDHSGTTKEIKAMQAQTTVQNQFINSITQGDCIQVMRQMPSNSVDFILTDPPYLVNYHDRNGRTIQNDADGNWLKPAMAQAYRVLKQDRVAIMFYGWTKIDAFFDAWRSAGFQPVGHLVFRKTYSSKSRFLRYQHEQAYLLAKGRPPLPKQPLADVMDMPYSGNKLHPTQKPVEALAPLVRSFTLPGELVLDPFSGSGSSCAAALLTDRRYVGIELDREYFHQATARLSRVQERIAAKKQSSYVLIPTAE
ncbi:MAG: DNA methyltransferase [Acidobacteriaceae bacterium]